MIHVAIVPMAILLDELDVPRLESPVPGTVLNFDGDRASLFPCCRD
jgi:hypothetical protein